MNKIGRLLVLTIGMGLILWHPMLLNKKMSNGLSESTNQGVLTAYFAGGCFWCMEPVFDAIEGVVDTTVGYMGGKKETANYGDVSSGSTAHVEAIKVVYDPNRVSYQRLLAAFWQSIDPTDPNGQFADQGPHYQTAVFINDESQRPMVLASMQELLSSKTNGKPIATKILFEQPFYEAEEYHQNYYQKNAIHYNAYKIGSGRAAYLKKMWGK